MKLLIKNGHVIDIKSGLNEVCDILIENKKVVQISKNIDAGNVDLINAEGKYVLPGLVDAHCHLRDPGYEYKEDIESGTKSAAAGGFTSIACMPNTNPVADSQSVISYIKNKASEKGIVNIFPIGSITRGQKGKELADIGELKSAGAVGISDDGNPVESSLIMKRVLMYSAMFDITVISHCEDRELNDDGVMNEGYNSTSQGLKGIPSASEAIMVSRDLLLAEYTNTPIHIAHVSTEMSVDLIRNAKKRGVKVTAETCPHYFSISDSACQNFNTMAKVNPPLRSQNDVKAVIEALKDGTIDIIATDHAPHHFDEKNVEFNLAANGISGFETAFSLAVTYLVKPKHLTMEQLVEKMSYNPARMMGVDKGIIEIEKEADIILADIDKKSVVNTNTFRSRGKNSPFDGFELSGCICYTIAGGKTVFKKE